MPVKLTTAPDSKLHSKKKTPDSKQQKLTNRKKAPTLNPNNII
jgi:hypothetical protein